MGAMVVVVVLPLLELGFVDPGIVHHGPVEEPIELLGVDAVGSLDLSTQPRG
jgi:hypothetical protein